MHSFGDLYFGKTYTFSFENNVKCLKGKGDGVWMQESVIIGWDSICSQLFICMEIIERIGSPFPQNIKYSEPQKHEYMS